MFFYKMVNRSIYFNVPAFGQKDVEFHLQNLVLFFNKNNKRGHQNNFDIKICPY